METRFFSPEIEALHPLQQNRDVKASLSLTGRLEKQINLKNLPVLFFFFFLEYSPLSSSAYTGKIRSTKMSKAAWTRCAEISWRLQTFGSWSETTLRQQRDSLHLWAGGVGTPKSNSPLFRHLQLRLLYCLDGSRFSKQPTLESKGNKRTIDASKRQISPLMNLQKKSSPFSWAIFVRLG